MPNDIKGSVTKGNFTLLSFKWVSNVNNSCTNTWLSKYIDDKTENND